VGLSLPERLGTGLDVKVGCEGKLWLQAVPILHYTIVAERDPRLCRYSKLQIQ
jgi:hypothetical protein